MSHPPGPAPNYMEGFESVADEDNSKFLQKVKNDPMVAIGIVGGLSALGYSIYKFKTRQQKLSVYLIHTRLAAQGAVVGALTLGVIYKLFDEYIIGKKKD